jgi:hypothetical protein
MRDDYENQGAVCTYCSKSLRLFLDPRPGPLRPNYRCDCEGWMHGAKAFSDPAGVIFPESRKWLLDHGYEIPKLIPKQYETIVDGS